MKREVSPHAPQRETRGDFEFQHRRGIAIPGPFSGPPIAPLPRNRLASSAAGGASPVSPTPPNDAKGRGCGPSPLDSPPGDRQRQRKEKQVKSVLHPGFAIPGRGLTTERFSKAWPAPNAGSSPKCPMSLVGTPVCKQKRRLLAPVLRKTFFLFHRARRIFFLMFQKENGGCIPTRRSRAVPRSCPAGRKEGGKSPLLTCASPRTPAASPPSSATACAAAHSPCPTCTWAGGPGGPGEWSRTQSSCRGGGKPPCRGSGRRSPVPATKTPL